MEYKSIKDFLLSTVGSGLITAVFILVAMVAIIAAQGRVITPEGKIKETSILRINSINKDFNVSVNGEEKVLKNNRVEFLEVGESVVEISKSGYRNWVRIINFEPSIVHDIYPLLILENIHFQDISADLQIDKIIFIDTEKNNNQIFFTSIKREKLSENGIWSIQIENKGENYDFSIKQLFVFDTVLLNKLQNQEYKIKISPNFSGFILDLIDSEEIYIGFFNTQNNNKSEFFLISDKLNFSPNKVEWLSNDRLLIKQNFNLFEYNLRFDEINVIYLSSEDDYIYEITSNGLIFTKKDDPKLFKYNVESKRRTEINMPKNFIYPSKIKNIYHKKNIEDIFILLTSQGLIYLNLKLNTYEILSKDQNSKIYDISNDGFKMFIRDSIEGLILINLQEQRRGSTLPGYKTKITEKEKVEYINFLSNNYNILIQNKQNEYSIADIDFQNIQTINYNNKTNESTIKSMILTKDMQTVIIIKKDTTNNNIILIGKLI